MHLLYTAGMLLKETIEDLEWTAIGSNNSTVEVCMQRQPRRLLFTAQAAGSLQVSFRKCHSHCSAFASHQSLPCSKYKGGLLQSAVTALSACRWFDAEV